MQGNAAWQLLMTSASAKPRPTLVATTSTTSTGNNATSITLTVPAGVQNGDLLIAVVCVGGNNPVDDWIQTSFTWPIENATTMPCVGVAYRTANSEPASYDFTVTSGQRLGGGMLAYRGAAWDVAGAITFSQTPTGITVSEANSVLLGFWAAAAGSPTTFSTPSGMAATGCTFTSSGNPNWAVFSEDVNAGATGATRTSTSSGSPDGSVLFSIKPA